MTDINRELLKKIEELKKNSLYISIKTVSSPIDAEVIIDGKKYINLSSNNYLGLANNKRLKNASIKAINKYGIGPAAVRTISGTTELHTRLEKALSKFKKVEDVVVYQSGFNANLSVIPAMVSDGDFIISDELNHASIIDACRLSKAEIIRYNHLNTEDLEAKIRKIKSTQKKLIVTDGVFSMDGDIAPLPQIYKVAKKYKALIMIDDAHGEGVLGKHGRGIVDHFNLHGKIDIEVGTLSKAFGVVGGFAAGSKEIISWLKQKSRPFLFSSALSIPDTAAAIEAVNILQNSDKLIKKLWQNSFYFKNNLKKFGFNIGSSMTPITPIIIGDELITQKLSKKIFEKGVFATAIVYPTVAKGRSRIRAIVSSAHTKKQLEAALFIIKEEALKLKII